jgi:hypothetical protein
VRPMGPASGDGQDRHRVQLRPHRVDHPGIHPPAGLPSNVAASLPDNARRSIAGARGAACRRLGIVRLPISPARVIATWPLPWTRCARASLRRR